MTPDQDELLKQMTGIVRLCVEAGREAEAEMFDEVDFYRLAHAFGVSIEKVHEAVGFTGTLYRRRAS